MNINTLRSLVAVLAINILPFLLNGSIVEEQKKEKMIEDLAIIKHHLEAGYAPVEWKRETFAWSIEEEFEKCKQEILSIPNINVRQFQKTVKRFLNSFRDYHVGVSFVSTEKATLPFTIKGAENRYFIDWIDTVHLSPSIYNIRVGDELVEFDGQPIAQVIEELKVNEISSNPLTDQRLAEKRLTKRKRANGDEVPNKAVLLTTISSRNNEPYSCQIRWKYTPERILNPLDLMESTGLFSKNFTLDKQLLKKKRFKIKMFNPLYLEKNDQSDRPNALGSIKGFLPPLGEVIWTPNYSEDSSGNLFAAFDNDDHVEIESFSGDKEENEKPEELNLNSDLFQSYIYQHPQGANIGFLRIPTYYKIKPENLEDLEALIIYLNEQTDALVIDQQNNSGGYHHHVCTIASMLTDRPLITPLMRLKLTHQIVGETYKNSKAVQNLLDKLEFFGLLELFEINYQEHLFLKSYLDFIIDEWNAGRTLTNPTHIGTIDYIHPHSTARYTKPILFLINELDFSSADFMPAILQDSKRAYLFGERTAGAGGAVETLSFPNTNGIRSFSCTTTIGERVGDRKIENLGVEPDFHYQLTVDDIRSGYKSYINAVNATLETILSLEADIPSEASSLIGQEQ